MNIKNIIKEEMDGLGWMSGPVIVDEESFIKWLMSSGSHNGFRYFVNAYSIIADYGNYYKELITRLESGEKDVVVFLDILNRLVTEYPKLKNDRWFEGAYEWLNNQVAH